VYEGCKISAVIEDEVELLAIFEGGKLLLEAPVVLLFGLALPGKAIRMSDGVNSVWIVGRRDIHWSASSRNCSSGVILRGEDVAAGPCNLGAQCCESLNEDGGLNCCGQGSDMSESGWQEGYKLM
jgi:hypothetical protein